MGDEQAIKARDFILLDDHDDAILKGFLELIVFDEVDAFLDHFRFVHSKAFVSLSELYDILYIFEKGFVLDLVAPVDGIDAEWCIIGVVMPFFVAQKFIASMEEGNTLSHKEQVERKLTLLKEFIVRGLWCG